MPLPHFLALVLGTIVVAALTLAVAHAVGLPLIWLALGGLVAAAVVRSLAWR